MRESYRMIYAERDRFPLQLMLRLLGVSKSGHLSWFRFKRYRSIYHLNIGQLDHLVGVLFIESDKTFGSPRLYRALKNLGIKISLNTVDLSGTDGEGVTQSPSSDDSSKPSSKSASVAPLQRVAEDY